MACVASLSAQMPMFQTHSFASHCSAGETMLVNPTGEVRPSKKSPQKAIDANQGQLWWGYYAGDESTWKIDGVGRPITYCVAIYIPSNLVAKPGATIAAASVFMIANNYKNLKVWISKELPKSAEEADMEFVKVANSSVKTMSFTDVAFKHEHEIPEEGLFVGYEFTITRANDVHDQYPLVYNDYSDSRGTFLISESGTGQWDDWSSYGESLVFRVLLSGDKLMQNAAEAGNIGQRYVLLGSSADVFVELTNKGLKGISSIDYVIDTDDTPGSQQHLDLPETFTALGGKTYVKIHLKADDTTGNRVKTLRIVRVNGASNEIGESESKGALFTVAKKAPVTPVVEEFTGNWCGWCPRGITGMDLLKNDFGNKIVQIAVHFNDPMYVKDYLPVIGMSGSFPNAFISRRYSVDPYFGSSEMSYGIKDDVTAFFDEVTPASVEAKAQWADKEKTKILVTATTTFQFEEDNPKMGIGYVLLADGLKGADWKQANYYSGNTNYLPETNLSPWVSKGEEVSGLEYNHVAVAAWGVDRGLKGSINGPVKVGQKQEYTYLLDISETKLVQNKDKLTVAVLLINSLAGDVFNGQQVEIAPYDATGISYNNVAPVPENRYYNLNGQRVEKPTKGITIMKLSNGKSVKVMTK